MTPDEINICRKRVDRQKRKCKWDGNTHKCSRTNTSTSYVEVYLIMFSRSHSCCTRWSQADLFETGTTAVNPFRCCLRFRFGTVGRGNTSLYCLSVKLVRNFDVRKLQVESHGLLRKGQQQSQNLNSVSGRSLQAGTF